MNERLKFRAWANAWGTMTMSEEFDLDSIPLFPPHRATLGSCDTSSMTIMQSPGLKDKNGKLIFEGDIYRTRGKGVYQVMFINGAFVGGLSPESCAPLGWDVEEVDEYEDYTGELMTIEWTHAGMEIIGNIYENKELLDA